jgi:23S rRNA pseudouridine2605 synthase
LPRVIGARWITVGWLDFQTSGLLLVTRDGELANKLMHPSSELSDEQQQRLLNDIRLEDGNCGGKGTDAHKASLTGE